jgi:hypothetical protein
MDMLRSYETSRSDAVTHKQFQFANNLVDRNLKAILLEALLQFVSYLQKLVTSGYNEILGY